MRHLARAILTLAVLAFLAAIWLSPWWAWLLTGVLLLIVGAAISGQATQPEQERFARGGFIPGPTTITNPTDTPERITRGDVDQHKRTYGRKADDQ